MMNRYSPRLALALTILCLALTAEAEQAPLTIEQLHDIVLEQQRQLKAQQAQIEALRRLLQPKAPAQAANPANSGQPESAVGQRAPVKHKPARDVRVSVKNGVKLQTVDGDFDFKIGGRLHLDTAVYDGAERKLGDGSELRRARVYVAGRVYDDWRYRASYDFAEDNVSVKSAWIRYSGLQAMDIQLGQFQEPFSLEELTGSNYTTFMERALPNALVPGYKLGLGAHAAGDDWGASAGIFNETVGDRADEGVDDGWGLAGRLTYAPRHSKTQTAHLGAAFEYREPDGNNRVRYRTPPETHVAKIRLIDTDDILDVDHTWKYGLETAAVMGPFSLQGEYILSRVSRNSGSNLDFDGWYLYGSWFPTGESRRYQVSRGVFRGVKPQHRYGAWELALRFSRLNLEDGDVSGGEEHNWTFGVNWYPNRNMRFMANYVRANADPSTAEVRPNELRGVSDEPNIFQLRAQANF